VALQDDLVAEIGHLRAFARSLTGDPVLADDLAQETITKAWVKLDTFQEGTNLRAWLFTILRNTFLSMKRKQKREFQDSDGVFAAQLVQLPEQASALELENLRAACMKLPDNQREALILVGAAGFTYDEAAKVCGCAPGTVKSRVSRARKRLEEIMDMEAGDVVEADPQIAQVLSAASVGI